ncbi:CBN-ALH-4 protein [Caenorhabditis brenneri]|uniref:CBN-ALH-4 protein n=1 Tax=Caenorhabditis brenneri TaxID=135651 RepID=G0MXU1_CAEBE|nr:CBN-ALH-4 protein [Caenorhabditis brenneri]
MAFTELVETQRKYFRSGETKPVQFRKQQLLKLKKFIEENREALAEAVWKDLRRRHESTEILEIGMTIGEIDYFLKNIDEWVKPTHVEKTFTTALDKPVIEKDPKGVVLIVSPWNYPVSMILLPMVPAIAAGNTVVIKPSELSENVAATFEKLIPKYFDPKYVAVVNGGIPETTDLLKERFDHILYTGCPPVAKIIMTAAAKHLTPVTLELGGKCPVVVEDDADIDISAKRIAWGKWLNCGQTCLAPDYILVNSTVKPKLVAAICKYVHEFYGEDIKSSKDYARIINQRHFDRITGLLEKTQGATLLGGESDRTDLYIPPTILDVEKSDAFMHDEIFGPVLPIITVKSFSESLEYIADGEKPLAAYIFTRNEAKVKRLLNETSSGGVTVNDVLMHITGMFTKHEADAIVIFQLILYHSEVLEFPEWVATAESSDLIHSRMKSLSFTEVSSESHCRRKSRYPPLNQQKLDQMRRLTGKRISLNLINVATLPIVMASFVFGMLFQFQFIFRFSA